jgi:hypothetical protein
MEVCLTAVAAVAGRGADAGFFLVSNAEVAKARATLGDVMTRRLSFASGTGEAVSCRESMRGRGVTFGCLCADEGTRYWKRLDKV